jgi:hypothetical protein
MVDWQREPAPENGGVMAGYEFDGALVKSGNVNGQRLDQERGQDGAGGLPQELTDRMLAENLLEVAACILSNVGENDLRSANLLLGLARKAGRNEEVPVQEYESLAELLKKEYLRQQQELEAENVVVLA